MSYTKIIATRLKALRKKNGLTQAQLAEELGVSRSTLASWEIGVREPDALDLDTIRDYFNVSGDYLLGFTDECSTLNFSGAYNIDFNKLNSLGKQSLYEIYNSFIQSKVYKK